jgi:hypothetical protein
MLFTFAIRAMGGVLIASLPKMAMKASQAVGLGKTKI